MKLILVVLCISAVTLVGCSFAVREDVDQIGSQRRSYTLGWKEGPREEAYRPARQEVHYHQAPRRGRQQQEADCEPGSAASPRDPWPAWVK